MVSVEISSGLLFPSKDRFINIELEDNVGKSFNGLGGVVFFSLPYFTLGLPVSSIEREGGGVQNRLTEEKRISQLL